MRVSHVDSRNALVVADLVDARVVCFGKWNLTIQRASGDQRDTDVGSK